MAASSLLNPLAIARQNGHRAARCNTGGRPSEPSFARKAPFDVRIFFFTITSS
jgi:hypothetical protein